MEIVKGHVAQMQFAKLRRKLSNMKDNLKILKDNFSFLMEKLSSSFLVEFS